MSYIRSGVLWVLITTALFAQPPARVGGNTINHKTGEPIGFVQIIIVETHQGTVSNAVGVFELPRLTLGTYTLQATHIGFDSYTTTIEVLPLQKQSLTLTLNEQPILLDEILVSANSPLTMKSEIHSSNLSERAPHDVGDFFKVIPGGAAVKKGGYALDPSLRGFQKDQLNIQFDGGIKVWGGCPNRMDPPTSHIQAGDLEKIEIIKGPYSVRWGQTLGGIVNLVMKKPALSDSFQLQGSVSSAYESNGNNLRSRLSLTGGTKSWDFYLGAGAKAFHDYRTGIDSVTIPSEYEIKDVSVKLAYNFSTDNQFQVSLRRARVANVDFPALPMDARKDASDIVSVGYSLRNISPLIHTVNTKLYLSEVTHVMDNFARPNVAMVAAATDANTRTTGGRLEVGLRPLPGQMLHVGIDYYDHDQQGYRQRFVKTNPCNITMHPNTVFTDSVWQDAAISDLGGFAELRHFINPKWSYTAGFRMDLVRATLGKPASGFTRVYGAVNQWDEQNFSGMGILKYAPSARLDLTLALGRGTRSADITERFINHLPVGVSAHEHLGNPALKAEVNDQAEFGLTANLVNHHLRGNIYLSHLDNYIFAKVDSSINRVFLPCQQPAFTKVFQNLAQARQMGAEVILNGQLAPALNYELSAAYTQGEDLASGMPLPEMPPLTAVFNLRYNFAHKRLWLQIESRWVGTQDRVSLEYGETSTPGFRLFNFKSGWTMFEKLQLNMTINNILNTAYYEHLSRNFSKNTSDSGLPLYEPGRNLIMNIVYQF